MHGHCGISSSSRYHIKASKLVAFELTSLLCFEQMLFWLVFYFYLAKPLPVAQKWVKTERAFCVFSLFISHDHCTRFLSPFIHVSSSLPISEPICSQSWLHTAPFCPAVHFAYNVFGLDPETEKMSPDEKYFSWRWPTFENFANLSAGAPLDRKSESALDGTAHAKRSLLLFAVLNHRDRCMLTTSSLEPLCGKCGSKIFLQSDLGRESRLAELSKAVSAFSAHEPLRRWVLLHDIRNQCDQMGRFFSLFGQLQY